MKHIKPILLTLLTVLITLSASAQVLYEQNFESVSDPADAGWTYGGQSMTIESDAYGKFIRFSQGQNNGRSAQLTWGTDIFLDNDHSVLPDGKYRMSYDFSIAQGSNNQYNSAFTVFTNHNPIPNQPYRTPWNPVGYWQNYIFDMSQVSMEPCGFAINGGTIETVAEDGTVSYAIEYSDSKTFEQGKWYTVTLDVDVNARTVSYSVVSLEGEMVQSGIRNVPKNDSKGDQISMYAEGLFIMMARYQTVFEIDNIKIEINDSSVLPPSLAAGDDFQYQGIWYTVIDPDAKTCKTKDGVKTTEGNIFEEIDEYLPGNIWEGDLIIPSSVSDGSNSYTVVGIGYAGFANNLGLTSVKISDSVSWISTSSFIGCKNLQSVDIPESLKEIWSCAFYACESLADIQLPPYLAVLKNEVFSQCSSLISIKIPDTIEMIEKKTFMDCSALESIILPASLTEIHELAFIRCASLTKIDFPEGLNSIGDYAFQECTNLSEIVLPESLSYLGEYALSQCPNIKQIRIPESISSLEEGVFWQNSSLKSVVLPNSLLSIGSYAFAECTSLIEINVPQNLTEIQRSAFRQCSSLESVELPQNISSIGDYAFQNCTKLSEIVLPLSLSYLGEYALSICPNLKQIRIPESISSLEEGVFWQCSSLESVALPNSLLSIGASAFSECPRLIEINLPQTLTEIQKSAFWQCSSLESVELPQDITSIGDYAFQECTNLSEILLPVSLTYLGKYALSICPNLKQIRIPESISSLEEGMFWQCSSLESVELPTTLSSIGDAAFEECTNLTEIALPESLSLLGRYVFAKCTNLKNINIPQSISSLGVAAFWQCSSLETVNLPISLQAVGEAAFQECTNLTEINWPQSLVEIKFQGFLGCTSIESVEFPVSLVSIGESAFSGCTGLKNISLPASLREFGDNAFQGCDNIEDIYYSASYPIEASSNVFSDITYYFADLIVPNAYLYDIAYTTPWSMFEYVKAKDGNLGFANVGDDFEYEGIWYTVIDPEAKTVMTKKEAVYYIPGYSFEGELNIPASVIHEGEEYSVVEIGSQSFIGTNVVSVSLPNTVVNIGYAAFRDCTKMTELNLPYSLRSIEEYAFYGNSVTEVNYMATTPIVASDYVFNWNVYNNATLNAPNATLAEIQETNPWRYFRYINASDGSVAPVLNEGTDFEYEGIWYTVVDSYEQTCKTKAGETNGESTISGNNVAGDIVIPAQASDGFNNYTVIGIGHDSFLNNTELTSVKLPETVAYLGDSSFSGCSSLTYFEFPASLTELGAYAFQNCTGFTAVDIPATVTSIGAGLFSDCSNLASVNLPNSISSIELNTFAACTSLTEIEIPSSVTSIGTGAFIQCTRLSKVAIPTSVESIGISAFAYCTGLISIEIPTSVKSIGFSAFTDCTGLSSIDIPANVAFIGDSAFAGCDALGAVSYQASKPITAAADVFSNIVYANVMLEAPNATVADIRSTIPWSLFRQAIASDGSIGFVEAGYEFEYDGIWYTVIDPDAKTCKTKGGTETNGEYVNLAEGNLVIPETAVGLGNEYTVTEIGDASFWGNPDLLSVTIPESVSTIGVDAFSSCQRLTSLVLKGHIRLQKRVVDEIGNPNLLLYVEDVQYAPESMAANVVADGVCENLEVTPGYAFTPLTPFTALQSRMVKEFTQHTPIGGTAGWETIVLPFDVTSVYAENIGSLLTPFSLVTDIYVQRPYWLYEADPKGEWKHGYGIQAGVPYLISTPNNAEYPEYYNVNGPVVFSSDQPQRITPATTAPYAVTWASGREFRSLWLPLDAVEAIDAMGLNAGVNGLTDDEGQLLSPGSAFHTGIVPKPLEAYVTRIGTEKAMRIMGNQSAVLPVVAENGLDIRVEDGKIHALSATDRTIQVITPEGVIVRMVNLKAGEPSVIDGLTDGIYLVAGRKLILR